MIGISPDSVEKHQRFKAKRGYTYPLIADTEHALCQLYGVWVQKSIFGKKYWGVNRTTFVIDAKGKVARIFEKVNPFAHATEVAEAVRALR